jgi:hypothetical protein
MTLNRRPLNKIWLFRIQLGCCSSGILVRRGPWVEMKVVVELSVYPGKRYTTMFRPEAAMVNCPSSSKWNN